MQVAYLVLWQWRWTVSLVVVILYKRMRSTDPVNLEVASDKGCVMHVALFSFYFLHPTNRKASLLARLLLGYKRGVWLNELKFSPYHIGF
jgi:hypothetical protein